MNPIDWLEQTIERNKQRLSDPGWAAHHDQIKSFLPKLQDKLDRLLNAP